MTSAERKLRWGDEELGEEDALPPTEETEVDENGVKLKIEYYRNDKGQTVKKTTKIRVVSVQQKVYKITKEREQWERFGRATGNVDGVSAVSNEEVPFDNVRAKAATFQQKKIEDIQKNLQATDNKTIVGSIGDMLQQRKEERIRQRAKGGFPNEGEQPVEETPEPATAQKQSDRYVPPKHRDQESGGYRRSNENSVRVTNLADDVAESDLQVTSFDKDFFARIYLAVDKETGRSRGFAFINFNRREEAERAINALNGFGYSNLILHCEWAAPKERKQS